MRKMETGVKVGGDVRCGRLKERRSGLLEESTWPEGSDGDMREKQT